MNPRHLSLSNEHHTPPDVVNAGHETLGSIDLDPASSEVGNYFIKAKRYYSIDNTGFDKPWNGTVFLNPPGGRCDIDGTSCIKLDDNSPYVRVDGKAPTKLLSSQKEWWFKLAQEWLERRTTAAIFVSFSIELLQTTQIHTPLKLLTPHEFPICYPKNRLAYWKVVDGKLVKSKSPPHASALVFLPKDRDSVFKFFRVHSKLGRVVVPTTIWSTIKNHER